MKPWLDSYPDGIPATIEVGRQQTVVSLFDDAVTLFPEHTALECFGRSMTYQQLAEASDAVAAMLQARVGISRGDRVAVMLPNVFACPVVMLGILKAGAVQVNVNPLYTSRELEHQLNDSGAETLFIFAASTPSLAPIRSNTALSTVVTVNPGDGAGLDIPRAGIPGDLGEHARLSDLLDEFAGQRPQPVELSGDDYLFLQYAGGTTGPSKGAILTHTNLVANTMQFRSFMHEASEPGKEVIAMALPLYHIFGLMVFIAYSAIGGKFVLVPNPRDMEAYLNTIKASGFTVIGGVNTLYAGMTQHPLFREVDVSRLKLAIGGGSKIFRSTSEAWKALTGVHIVEGFGLSETSPAVTMNLMGQGDFSGTVGYPVPSTEVKVIDDTGAELPAGSPGELCVKGPQVMAGYWNRAQATEAAFTSDGYFRTGDVAIMHPGGSFEIVDRKKDMIIVSGFNVYPNEIEAVVSELDSIEEAACVGAPDDRTGERIRLFVAPAGDADIDPDKVLEHCRNNLVAYKVPREVRVLDELPKTNVGKILRKDLREQ